MSEALGQVQITGCVLSLGAQGEKIKWRIVFHLKTDCLLPKLRSQTLTNRFCSLSVSRWQLLTLATCETGTSNRVTRTSGRSGDGCGWVASKLQSSLDHMRFCCPRLLLLVRQQILPRASLFSLQSLMWLAERVRGLPNSWQSSSDVQQRGNSTITYEMQRMQMLRANERCCPEHGTWQESGCSVCTGSYSSVK